MACLMTDTIPREEGGRRRSLIFAVVLFEFFFIFQYPQVETHQFFSLNDALMFAHKLNDEYHQFQFPSTVFVQRESLTMKQSEVSENR